MRIAGRNGEQKFQNSPLDWYICSSYNRAKGGSTVDLMDKLTILADAAKYDAACTSSGVDRRGGKGMGSTMAAGCCHSFSADGRCISLLKVL